MQCAVCSALQAEARPMVVCWVSLSKKHKNSSDCPTHHLSSAPSGSNRGNLPSYPGYYWLLNFNMNSNYIDH